MEEFLRFLHVLVAAVLFGTGLAIAFFLAAAHGTRNPAIIAHVAGSVVVADKVFIATAFALQPLTGMMIAGQAGWNLADGWVMLSIILYAIAGLFWLTVVTIQVRVRNIAERCAAYGRPLTDEYFRLYRACTLCNLPALLSVIGIFWLMASQRITPF